jgi:hypothetical protein
MTLVNVQLQKATSCKFWLISHITLKIWKLQNNAYLSVVNSCLFSSLLDYDCVVASGVVAVANGVVVVD